MPWVISYKQDTDLPGVGTLSAAYSEVNQPSVSVARRLDTNNGDDVARFLTECETALAKSAKLAGDSQAIVAKMDSVLNGGK